MLEIDRYCTDAIGASALRPDVRLLCFIIVHQSASIKEALLDSALSYRAFYNMLDRLKRRGLIAVEVDSVDGRVRRIVLGGQFDRLMGKMPHF
jgi:DNA-binding MarR family transcriptional regulator